MFVTVRRYTLPGSGEELLRRITDYYGFARFQKPTM